MSAKRNIKHVDRLLGLHQELPQIYKALAQQHVGHLKNPTILIDWSELAADGRSQLLRTSIALEGRSVTLFEEVHPQAKLNNPCVNRLFQKKLASMLAPDCVPIIITDAGFRGAWFRLLNKMGWCWIGRIRNHGYGQARRKQTWRGCKTFYTRANQTPRRLGQFHYVRARPVACSLMAVKRHRKGRHKLGVRGKRSRSQLSLEYSRRQREPWLLAVSPGLAHLSAESVETFYSKRMQIEEESRDLKSERFGLGLSAHRTQGENRLSVLLLIPCLAACRT